MYPNETFFDNVHVFLGTTFSYIYGLENYFAQIPSIAG